MNIVFAGTPHFADTALKALLQAGHTVSAVFTQPDRPSGRGMKLTPSPVKQTAVAANIPVHQPISLRLDGKYPDEARAAQEVLNALRPDVMVVAAYGLILPQWVLDLPRAGCLNIHASLLPRWRGAAPIQRAIQAGDTESGVCLMQMELGLDTGPIHAHARVPITPDMTGDALHDALATLGADLLCQQLPAIVAGHTKPVIQPSEGVSYASKLQRSDGLLNWQLPAQVLVNQIRAFDSALGCYFQQGEAVFKVWAATAVASHSDAPLGTILGLSAAGLDVQVSDGILRIMQIQKPGGKRLPIAACWQHLGSDLNTPLLP